MWRWRRRGVWSGWGRTTTKGRHTGGSNNDDNAPPTPGVNGIVLLGSGDTIYVWGVKRP